MDGDPSRRIYQTTRLRTIPHPPRTIPHYQATRLPAHRTQRTQSEREQSAKVTIIVSGVRARARSGACDQTHISNFFDRRRPTRVARLSRMSTCRSPLPICRPSHRTRRGQRTCRSCHAAYMRAHRPKHRDLAEQMRRKANCRSYTNVLQRRGVLAAGPCQCCGAPAENHHPDYADPRRIDRLCRSCHRAHHVKRRRVLD